MPRHVAFAVLLAVCGFTPAAADSTLVTVRVPAPDSQRAQWQSWLGRQDSLRVTHVEHSMRPVSFPTRLPCAYDVRIQHEDAVLAGDAVKDIVGFLLDEIALPDGGPCRSACAGDTVDGRDEIEITAFGEGRMLRFQFHPRTGSLEVAGLVAHSWCGRPGVRAESLLARLAAQLPDDIRLPGLFVCADTTNPLAAQVRDPRNGEFVFIETLPEVVKKVPPEYPREAIDDGLEATVVVRALVGKDGSVKKTALTQTGAAFRVFYASAVKGVEQYRFKPAVSNGAPVAVWVAIPVRYKLTD